MNKEPTSDGGGLFYFGKNLLLDSAENN